MSKNVKYKTTYLNYGEVIVKGPCKYEDKHFDEPAETVKIVDPLGNPYRVGEYLCVLKSEFIEKIKSTPRKKKPSDAKCYKWMVDNGWKEKSNWKEIQKAYQWVFNNQEECAFTDDYWHPSAIFFFYRTPDYALWFNSIQ